MNPSSAGISVDTQQSYTAQTCTSSTQDHYGRSSAAKYGHGVSKCKPKKHRSPTYSQSLQDHFEEALVEGDWSESTSTAAYESWRLPQKSKMDRSKQAHFEEISWSCERSRSDSIAVSSSSNSRMATTEVEISSSGGIRHIGEASSASVTPSDRSHFFSYSYSSINTIEGLASPREDFPIPLNEVELKKYHDLKEYRSDRPNLPPLLRPVFPPSYDIAKFPKKAITSPTEADNSIFPISVKKSAGKKQEEGVLFKSPTSTKTTANPTLSDFSPQKVAGIQVEKLNEAAECRHDRKTAMSYKQLDSGELDAKEAAWNYMAADDGSSIGEHLPLLNKTSSVAGRTQQLFNQASKFLLLTTVDRSLQASNFSERPTDTRRTT